jgi:hypothetical protein
LLASDLALKAVVFGFRSRTNVRRRSYRRGDGDLSTGDDGAVWVVAIQDEHWIVDDAAGVDEPPGVELSRTPETSALTGPAKLPPIAMAEVNN